MRSCSPAQLLVRAATAIPRRRIRPIASSITGRGPHSPIRSIISAAESVLTRLATLRLEGAEELLHGELSPLQPGPGAAGSRLDHDPIDEARGDAQLPLVAGDRVERGVENDAAQIEDHGPVSHGPATLAKRRPSEPCSRGRSSELRGSRIRGSIKALRPADA